MDRPQGLVLRPCPGGGLEAEIVRDKSRASPAPRLAVVLDYLWFGGKPLFQTQDITVPLKNRALNLEDFSPDSWPALPMNVPMHLVSKGLEEPYKLKLDPKVLAYFADDGLLASSPVECIKLHAVDQNGGKYKGCLVLETDGYDAAKGQLTLSAKGKDVGCFIEWSVKRTKSPLYFLSVHFAGGSDFYGGVEYDLASPWCFPASHKRGADGVYGIRRGFGFGAPGNEYPVFNDLQDIPEYQTETET
jgi:hypothetical protein